MAHSTVSVDHREQGILAQRGEIWSPPVAELRVWASAADCVVMAGRHDGYRRLANPVWHRRTVVTMHGLYWLIIDELLGTGVHEAEQRFHVAPGAVAEERPGAGGVRLAKGGAVLSLSWAGHDDSFADRSTGRPQVRIDPSSAELLCGCPEQSTMVVAQHKGLAPYGMAVVASSGRQRVRVRWSGGFDALGSLIVAGDSFTHEVYVRRDADRRSLFSGWRNHRDERGYPPFRRPSAAARCALR